MSTTPIAPQDNFEQEQRNAQGLAPTLIIGIGGSGGDVLLRVRKKFFEMFGGVEEFPIVKYLWFDLDKSYQHVGAKQFAKKVDFSGTEEHLLLVKDVAEVTNNLNNPAFHDIREWWPVGIPHIAALDDGAGQYRPYSRLALFYHYDRVAAAISSAVDALINFDTQRAFQESPKLRERGYAATVDPNQLRVYLVGSLAGGTGSGMFLDLAHIVQMLYPKSQRVGFLITSRFFPNQNDRMQANTYAALMEWDYYNEHTRRPPWKNANPNHELGLAFNYSYLFDSPNYGNTGLGARPEDQKKLFAMLADAIFKDFSAGDFAAMKRSMRVNVTKHIGEPQLYPEPSSRTKSYFTQKFNRRYQSFGQASILVPHDRIITACSYLLAAGLMRYWKGIGTEDSSSIRISESAQSFISAAKLDEQSLWERMDDVEGKANIGGKRLRSEISDQVQALMREISSIANEDKAQALRNKANDLRQLLFASTDLTEKNATVEQAWRRSGRIVQRILENREALLKEAREEVQKQCNKRINEHFSVSSTIAFINEICERLSIQQKSVKAEIDEITRAIEAKESEFEQRLGEFGDHAVRPNLDFRKHIILDYDNLLVREALIGQGNTSAQQDDTPGLFLLVRRRVQAEQITALLGALISSLRGHQDKNQLYVGGLSDNYRVMDQGYEEAANRFERDARYFSERINDDLSTVLFDESELRPVYYDRIVTPSLLAELSEHVKAQLKITAASFKEADFKSDSEGMHQLVGMCRAYFERIRQDHHVVDVFFAKRGGDSGSTLAGAKLSDQMKADIDRLVKAAMPWAKFGGNQIKHYMPKPEQLEFLVGIPEAEGEGIVREKREDRIKALKDEIVERIKQYNTKIPVSFKEVPDTSEIIFHSEISGVPINYYDRIYEMRDVYLKARRTDPYVHLEPAGKFPDVLISTESELQGMISIWTVLSLARILGDVWVVKEENGRVEFGYTFERFGVESRPRMGDEMETLAYLRESPDDLNFLKGRVDNQKLELRNKAEAGDQAAKQKLVYISALLTARTAAILSTAQNGRDDLLPIAAKVEFKALTQLNSEISQTPDATESWRVSDVERKEALGRLDSFSHLDHDQRRVLKPGAAAGS